MKAPVAIMREARQVPDAKNNLQKRFCYKLSPYGPNPNGAHTVEKKKATVQAVPLQTSPGTGYTGLQISSAEALCKHFLDYELF